MIHGLELEWIKLLQQMRTPCLDQFFKFLNYFDRQEFFFVLIPIVWMVFAWKSGFRIFYILLLSGFINHALKTFFLSPRPYHIDPGMGLVHVGGFGFPSGAAQTVMLLSAIMVTSFKSPWKWAVVIPYFCLISLSRVYLGVHFPTDVFVGWIVGFGLWAIYVYVFPLLERRLQKIRPLYLLALGILLPFTLMGIQRSFVTSPLYGVAMGLAVGVFFAHRYKLLLPPSKNLKESILKACIGIAGGFVFFGLTELLPDTKNMAYLLPQFIFVGLWLSLGSQIICSKKMLSKF